MFVFGYDKQSRGCFASFDIGTQRGRGAYITFGGTTKFPADGKTVPYIVTSIAFAQKEKYALVQCFNNVIYTYAFGIDPLSSMISVQFVAFLVSKEGTGSSAAVKDFLSIYNTNRLSKNPKYSTVNIGGKALTGFVVGMSSSTASQETNLQNFSVDLVIVEPQGG